MISDNDRVVIRGGNDLTDPIIVFVEPTLDDTIALNIATSSDFQVIGSKPGISDDGRVVTFMGDSKTEGPSIYIAAINAAGDSAVRFKIADISGSNPSLPMRVGVNRSGLGPFDYKVVYLANPDYS